VQAPVSANLCMQLPQTGPCRSAICVWFYAAATASCMPLPCVEGSAALSNAPAPVCVEPQTNPYVIPDSYSGCWATGLHHLSLNYALVPQKGGVASGWKLGSGARAHVAGCEACSLGCKAPQLGAACPRSSALSTGKCSDSRMGESNWPGASGSGCRSSAGRSGRLRRCAGDGRMVSRESVQYFPHHRPSAFASSQVSSHSTGQIDLQRQAHQTGLFACVVADSDQMPAPCKLVRCLLNCQGTAPSRAVIDWHNKHEGQTGGAPGTARGAWHKGPAEAHRTSFLILKHASASWPSFA
jgi:hypothetical protein